MPCSTVPGRIPWCKCTPAYKVGWCGQFGLHRRARLCGCMLYHAVPHVSLLDLVDCIRSYRQPNSILVFVASAHTTSPNSFFLEIQFHSTCIHSTRIYDATCIHQSNTPLRPISVVFNCVSKHNSSMFAIGVTNGGVKRVLCV
jgi:hypothetical protein